MCLCPYCKCTNVQISGFGAAFLQREQDWSLMEETKKRAKRLLISREWVQHMANLQVCEKSGPRSLLKGDPVQNYRPFDLHTRYFLDFSHSVSHNWNPSLFKFAQPLTTYTALCPAVSITMTGICISVEYQTTHKEHVAFSKNMTVFLLIIHFDHKTKNIAVWGCIKSNQKCPLSKLYKRFIKKRICTTVRTMHQVQLWHSS